MEFLGSCAPHSTACTSVVLVAVTVCHTAPFATAPCVLGAIHIYLHKDAPHAALPSLWLHTRAAVPISAGMCVSVCRG